MSTASNLEREMLALINAERTSRGLNPLKLEKRLNDSAEDHSDWMLQSNNFSHTGSGGSSATQRMKAAGFDFSGNWRSGENIAWQSERGAAGASDDVAQLHQSLMNSPGHRANILNPDFEYIGIGIETGNFNGWNAVMVTQNFAKTSAPVQLDTGGTGNPGPSPTPPTPSTPVEVIVAAGTTGDNGDNWFTLRSDQAGVLDGRGGDDRLVGQSGNDTLFGRADDDELYGKNGHDVLKGGYGNDALYAGYGNDILKGGRDKDTMFGGEGQDILKGGDHADSLFGGAGGDKLAGGTGNDNLTGGSGADSFVFTSGTDRVKDFEDIDQIVLRNVSTINDFNDLANNHMTQSGSNVVINDGLGNSLILENTLLADLDSGHFLF
ncbi:CAP domain-containing protein [Ruegeria lacuscaerulensis]|uniref:CAP domain-containing protein n=1 Tax=Ruegeria lacuscaerulensis TaxID=55218 RepID=UPI001480D976|nr:CAP domain-containing protein [Ruegeria lacuscaerulensis]